MFGSKQDIVSSFCLIFLIKLFHAQKMMLIFIKYFLEKKPSLSHYITKVKKEKKRIYPPPFSNHPIPRHQRNNSLKKKKKTHLPTLRNNQASPSHITQEKNPLG
jgi:hypothetical protein